VYELLQVGAIIDGPSGVGLPPLQKATFTSHNKIIALLLIAKVNFKGY